MCKKIRPTTFVTTTTLVAVTSILGLGVRPVTATTPPPPPNGCSTTTTIDSTDPALPIAITDNATFTSTITVSGLNPVLWDVDVETFIRHTFCGNLDIFLESPAGTRITLVSSRGGDRDNLYDGTLWDDDAGDTNAPGPVTDTDFDNDVTETPLVPEEPLGAFIGEDPNGIWTLSVQDSMFPNSGSLDAWSLIITTLPEAPVNQANNLPSDDVNLPIAIPDTTTITSTTTVTGLGPFLCDIDLTTFIPHDFSGDLTVFLISPAGTRVTITTRNGGPIESIFNGTLWDDDAGDTVPPGAVTNIISLFHNIAETPLAPEEAMGAFIGEDPNGTWTLEVSDHALFETGELTDWSLDLTTCELNDSDGDGVADVCDPCPLDNPDDTDGDGVCDSNDICPGGDDAIDTDADGVPDFCDVCPGGDDNVDGDGDGVADFCDPCPADDPDDSDGDGVCDSDDACLGGDDNADGDGDGVADFCDPCPDDAADDSDGDGVCDSDDVCDGGDDTVDSDGDGEPDACDDTPTGQTLPEQVDCCGGSVPMMTPFMLMGWSWMQRRRRKHRNASA
ncbi:MAG: proprotein convertase P-domain-containing protein [Phycisphaerales bacterium]|nr:proprotein convertase P-domain-containing protein [Phycisphaerales bacterium]